MRHGNSSSRRAFHQKGLYLPVSLRMSAQTGEGGKTQVKSAASGQCLHEQRLVRAEVHDSHLVVEQLRYGRGGGYSEC